MKHRKIFDQLETIFNQAFKQRFRKTVDNDDIYIEIIDSDFYIRCNDVELTIGYGTIHRHFNEDYQNLNNAIDKIFQLITNRIKVQNFSKGNKIYKKTVEIEFPDKHIEDFGSMITMFYPFWKVTKIETEYYDKLINSVEIKDLFEDLKTKNDS